MPFFQTFYFEIFVFISLVFILEKNFHFKGKPMKVSVYDTWEKESFER